MERRGLTLSPYFANLPAASTRVRAPRAALQELNGEAAAAFSKALQDARCLYVCSVRSTDRLPGCDAATSTAAAGSPASGDVCRGGRTLRARDEGSTGA